MSGRTGIPAVLVAEGLGLQNSQTGGAPAQRAAVRRGWGDRAGGAWVGGGFVAVVFPFETSLIFARSPSH